MFVKISSIELDVLIDMLVEFHGVFAYQGRSRIGIPLDERFDDPTVIANGSLGAILLVNGPAANGTHVTE